MPSISVADCKEDGGYLSEFCNIHFKSLPLDTESQIDDYTSSKDNRSRSSEDHLKTKITGLTQELNEMKEFMADKMKKQVFKISVITV